MNAKSSSESSSTGYANSASKKSKSQVSNFRSIGSCCDSFPSSDAFYGTEDPTLHNVDVMTDASMPMTEFTRYTVAPTSVSRSSSKFVFGICSVAPQLKVLLDGARDRNENWKGKWVQGEKGLSMRRSISSSPSQNWLQELSQYKVGYLDFNITTVHC
jgi:hypothetical protein